MRYKKTTTDVKYLFIKKKTLVWVKQYLVQCSLDYSSSYPIILDNSYIHSFIQFLDSVHSFLSIPFSNPLWKTMPGRVKQVPQDSTE